MSEGYAPNFAEREVIEWTPVLPRSTISNLTFNRVTRIGNIVFLTARFAISESNSNNDYIDESCIPNFGRSRVGGTGTFF